MARPISDCQPVTCCFGLGLGLKAVVVVECKLSYKSQ